MLSFFTHLYKDKKYCDNLIYSIHKYHPASKIYVLVDGKEEHDLFDGLYEDYDHVTVIYGQQRLKKRIFGGQWTQRYLENIYNVSSDNEYVIKVDTDSECQRKVKEAVLDKLDFDIYACYSRKINVGGKLIQCTNGGARIIVREAIKKILDSEILESKMFRTDGIFAYRRYGKDFRKVDDNSSLENIPLINDDAIIGYIASELNLKIKDASSEFNCIFRGEVSNPRNKYSIVHPIQLN